MQELLRDRDGVICTRVGWTGGENDNPTEDNNSGHAEAVEVTLDPARISYRQLLEFFFMFHRADLGEGLVGSGYRLGDLLCERGAAQGGRGDDPRRRCFRTLARQGCHEDQ
jgi:hypothetical protein